MMQDRHTAELGSDEKGDSLLVDVDPSKSEIVFRIGKHRVHVSKTELWGFCFAIGDEATQEKLMPVRQTEVMKYTRVHTIKLKKDMRAGETLRARCEIDVPLTVVEGLQGMVRPRSSSVILPPVPM